MNKKTTYLVIAAAAIFFMAIYRYAWFTITDWLLPQVEGFRAHPYWDNKQYSWGYGTKAPGPEGTITREQALIDARKHLVNDYNYLKPLVKRNLAANQWAALLSFSYNLGTGNADNLVNNINSGNDAALEQQWKLYINAAGKPDPGLIERRNLEWRIWTGNV